MFSGILRLSPRQVLLGAPLSFAVFFIGTVLPTMVLIYAILLPRYLKLTGSAISTVLLGGLTYAAMHIVEGWSAFGSPRDAALAAVRPVQLLWTRDDQECADAAHGQRLGSRARATTPSRRT